MCYCDYIQFDDKVPAKPLITMSLGQWSLISSMVTLSAERHMSTVSWIACEVIIIPLARVNTYTTVIFPLIVIVCLKVYITHRSSTSSTIITSCNHKKYWERKKTFYSLSKYLTFVPLYPSNPPNNSVLLPQFVLSSINSHKPLMLCPSRYCQNFV